MNNVLLIYGGGGAEHEVSIRSKDYILSKLDTTLFNPVVVEISKTDQWLIDSDRCQLGLDSILRTKTNEIKIDVAIACIHGTPGETGEMAALFSLANIPYFGCNQETSVNCFNKLTTKLLLENAGVKTTPFISLTDISDIKKADLFFEKHQSIFIKATNQGSSIGCYTCERKEELSDLITKAFELSPYVLIEKKIIGRELEISTFEFDDQIHITDPSEILCESEFYTYNEKYSSSSKTEFDIVAKITKEQNQEIKRQARLAYMVLKIRHLSRMDFFISNDGFIYLNEINTFPGHTSISMFPRMMEHYGITYTKFINQHLSKLLK